MTGEYRLFRQGGGATAFCHVRVEAAEKAPGDPDVVAAIAGPESARPDEMPEWFAPAFEGASACLDALRRQGEALSKQIRILSLTSTHVDARPDAIAAAAFMATADALGRADRYDIKYRDGRWQAVASGAEDRR